LLSLVSRSGRILVREPSGGTAAIGRVPVGASASERVPTPVSSRRARRRHRGPRASWRTWAGGSLPADRCRTDRHERRRCRSSTIERPHRRVPATERAPATIGEAIVGPEPMTRATGETHSPAKSGKGDRAGVWSGLRATLGRGDSPSHCYAGLFLGATPDVTIRHQRPRRCPARSPPGPVHCSRPTRTRASRIHDTR